MARARPPVVAPRQRRLLGGAARVRPPRRRARARLRGRPLRRARGALRRRWWPPERCPCRGASSSAGSSAPACGGRSGAVSGCSRAPHGPGNRGSTLCCRRCRRPAPVRAVLLLAVAGHQPARAPRRRDGHRGVPPVPGAPVPPGEAPHEVLSAVGAGSATPGATAGPRFRSATSARARRARRRRGGRTGRAVALARNGAATGPAAARALDGCRPGRRPSPGHPRTAGPPAPLIRSVSSARGGRRGYGQPPAPRLRSRVR